MTDPEIDLGERCAQHLGEVFPPRCRDCDLATLEATNALVSGRLNTGASHVR